MTHSKKIAITLGKLVRLLETAKKKQRKVPARMKKLLERLIDLRLMDIEPN